MSCCGGLLATVQKLLEGGWVLQNVALFKVCQLTLLFSLDSLRFTRFPHSNCSMKDDQYCKWLIQGLVTSKQKYMDLSKTPREVVEIKRLNGLMKRDGSIKLQHIQCQQLSGKIASICAQSAANQFLWISQDQI